jgi:hypothetical protein
MPEDIKRFVEGIGARELTPGDILYGTVKKIIISWSMIIFLLLK